MSNNVNNIGLIRLMLASFVIISHAPVQIDGNGRREPILDFFGGISLGEIAVGGFFLISGYLISMSLNRSYTLTAYLLKRLLRIWPAYIVSCLVVTFLMAPLVGGHPFDQGAKAFIQMAFLLGPVDSPGQLAHMPYPVLNGSAWTISIEFGCYVLLVGAWSAQLFRFRSMLIGVSGVLLALAALGSTGWPQGFLLPRIGTSATLFLVGSPARLIAYFLVGAGAYAYRSEIALRLTGKVAVFAVASWMMTMFNSVTAVVGLAIFGGAAFFWLAFKADIGVLQRVNDRWDISYGTYLYGWPIATTILYFQPTIQPLPLTVLTLPFSWLAGALSWWGVEFWTKSLFGSTFLVKSPRGSTDVQFRSSL